MTTTNYVPYLFAQTLSSTLRRRNLEINDLAKLVDITYEHSRKLSKGMAFPSKHLLKAICKQFDLDYPQMERKVAADKIRKKHGTIPLELAGKDPRFEPFEHVLASLTDSQLQDLCVMAQAMAERNERTNVRVE